MPDSKRNVIYPPDPPIEIDPMEQLAFLNRAVKNAEEQVKHWRELRRLPILDPRRIFYKGNEIDEKLAHWEQTRKNMIRCWNTYLEDLKIK